LALPPVLATCDPLRLILVKHGQIDEYLIVVVALAAMA
jgi:hypothetical protein